MIMLYLLRNAVFYSAGIHSLNGIWFKTHCAHITTSPPQTGNEMLLYTDQRRICLQFLLTSLPMVGNFRVGSVTQHF